MVHKMLFLKVCLYKISFVQNKFYLSKTNTENLWKLRSANDQKWIRLLSQRATMSNHHLTTKTINTILLALFFSHWSLMSVQILYQQVFIHFVHPRYFAFVRHKVGWVDWDHFGDILHNRERERNVYYSDEVLFSLA